MRWILAELFVYVWNVFTFRDKIERPRPVTSVDDGKSPSTGQASESVQLSIDFFARMVDEIEEEDLNHRRSRLPFPK